MTTQTIFVFYKLNNDNLNNEFNWPPIHLNNDWHWIGSGITKTQLYPNEIQFNGPKQYKTQIRDYLHIYFLQLKLAGLVKRFKIRNSYKP
jgi:hypothetical protein